MFDKNSVGKRVIANDGDLGTIVKFNAERTRPVEVCFDNDVGTFWYTPSGECTCGYPEDGTIKVYYSKIGSPDARRIVAMLAYKCREYRNNSYDYTFMTELLYKEAKALLGDTNE